MKAILSNLNQRSADLADSVKNHLDIVGGGKLETTSWVSGHELLSDVVITRAGKLADLATSISVLPEERVLLVPSDRLINLVDQMRQLVESLNRYNVTAENIVSWGGSVSFDGTTVHAANGSSANVRSNLDELVAIEDRALQLYADIANWARPKGMGTFAAASRSLAGKAQEAGGVLEDIRSKSIELDRLLESISGKERAISGSQNESIRLTEEIEKARRTSEENAQRTAVATASIEEIRNKASSLEADIQKYQDQFTSFQSHLDAREKSITKGNEELSGLQTTLTQRQTDISTLVNQAKEMLGSATIAGLSAAYQNQASNVDSQLKWARLGFYVSIALLLGSVAVAINLTRLIGFAPLPTIQPGLSASALAVQTLASLGSRALVILPALLLAGFATHRHAALFRLREEYNHKSALAASVHGFKTQAPRYEEAIAAAVFQELLNNPAGTMDGSSGSAHSNGFITRLIAPAVETAVKKMLELRDGAITH